MKIYHDRIGLLTPLDGKGHCIIIDARTYYKFKLYDSDWNLLICDLFSPNPNKKEGSQ